MSSIRSLKKEINNSIGEIIEDVYAWELSNPSADLKKSDLIVDKAISLFDDLILKIHKNRKVGNKDGFKIIKEELSTAIVEFNDSISKLS
jgi:hypothetical protein|tara:strand:- start:154 stop:423 length:270 start_codon:yes stop_codon:yes gene_type:complete